MSGALLIAAPGSGSGKTTVTLGLIRAFRRLGLRVGSVKIGPDYIDPAFHTAAGARACVNLDAWAMRAATFDALAARTLAGSDLLVAEGVMGLFDGASAGPQAGGRAPVGTGSSADVAVHTGWPVILVVDAGGMAASAAAVVYGFHTFRDDLDLAGVIFNRVGSPRHGDLLRRAVEPLGLPVFGCLQRDPALELGSRHLGLVQAGEHPDLEAFLDAAADRLAEQVDLQALRVLAGVHSPPHRGAAAALRTQSGSPMSGRRSASPPVAAAPRPIPPLGQRIAVASDVAFAFVYPATLDGWRAAGAEVLPFSPLADEAPADHADAVYLPGGYPELHAGRLADCGNFRRGMQTLVARGAQVFGECGGYMVLGQRLTDAGGIDHRMLGCLPVHTSFATRKMNLGYRQLLTCAAGPLGPAGTAYRGHEFHFATVLSEATDAPLFSARDAAGRALGDLGLRRGSVAGSFIHLIDSAEPP